MKRTKPLIERYLTYLRVDKEKTIARLAETTPMVPQQAWEMEVACTYNDICTQMIEQATKYWLAPSATAMISTLCPHPPRREETTFSALVASAEPGRAFAPVLLMPIWRMPDAPVWLELEEPIESNTRDIAGLFFCNADLQIEQQLKKPQSGAMSSVLQAARCQGHKFAPWQLYFLDKNGTPTSCYQYFKQAKTWAISESESCPTGECPRRQQEKRVTGTTETTMTLCASCVTRLDYRCRWFVMAWLVLRGEYGVSIEDEWLRYREQTTREVKCTNSHKYDEIPVQHEYYMVSFA